MRQLMAMNTLRFGLLAAAVLAAFIAACLLLAAKPAHTQFILVFTVNSTGDEPDANVGDNVCATSGGACTLRAAIQEANANGTTATDNIWFNIPGSGVKVISPATLLPKITAPVAIDGYSQPGATENTLAVGNNANLLIRLDKPPGGAPSGLWLDTNDSGVWGLSITGFSDGAGVIVRGNNNTVAGNFIGTDPGGTLAGVRNFDGVTVFGNSSNNLVGGTSPAARNVISGNGREGVRINTNPLQGGNRVQGNYIGTTRSGTGDLGNTTAGVIDNSFGVSGNLIGGTTPATANTIAFNETGVQVGDGFIPVGISILGNSIFSNDDLGIDLNDDGVTANDDQDPDIGPNNLQNSPVLTRARTPRRGGTIIAGSFNSTPGQTFIVQFFLNRPGENEGRSFLGQQSVTTDASGNAPIVFRSRRLPRGFTVTATATDTFENTSEFSNPVKVTQKKRRR